MANPLHVFFLTQSLCLVLFAAEPLPPFQGALTCPADVEVPPIQGNLNGTVVSYPSANATDNEGQDIDVPISYSVASGSFFHLGVTTVSVSVYDPLRFRRIQCRFTVTVRKGRSLTCKNIDISLKLEFKIKISI